MRETVHQTYSFDGFTLDLTRGSLLHGDEEIRLRPKSYTALKFLVENSGRLVTKDELVEAVWSDTAVTDNSLVQCMKEVRVALGDHSQRYIKTVPRRGYIFEERVTTNAPSETVYVEEVEELRLVVEEQRYGGPEAETEEIDKRNGALQIIGKRPRLRILAPAIMFVAAIAILAYYLISTSTPATVAISGVRSIAVLPFKPLNGQEGDEYLGLGIADTLITRLSGTKEITVRPTSSIQKYTSQDQDTLSAGKQQRVDAVLEGSIQRYGDRIRVTARLINTGDGSTLWAYKSDESYTDIFALQDAISEKVASALAVQVSGSNRAKRYTDNAEAYQLYLRGRFFWEKRTKEDLFKAIEYFERATQVDPSYALAYAGIAHCYGPLGYRGHLAPSDATPKMRAAAAKALELDETLAEAHTAMGAVKAFHLWDWNGAEREFKRAIELDPNYPTAHQWYGLYLEAMGRQDENLAERRRAQELDPLNLSVNTGLGTVYYYSGEYDRAIEVFQKTLELDPNFEQALNGLGDAYMQKGMHEEALPYYKKALDSGAAISRSKALLSYAYAKAGNRDQSIRLEQELLDTAKIQFVSPFFIALIHVGRGDKDRAFEWLEKAFSEGDPPLNHINVEPTFNSLRSDPRFTSLLRRMHLGQ